MRLFAKVVRFSRHQERCMKSKKEHKLTPVEQAIIVLAKAIECCPLNEYLVVEQILDILDLEAIKKDV
jgi:hypothetical protein